jgi:acetyltransferase-like isoleucine patch superfamily enzyme
MTHLIKLVKNPKYFIIIPLKVIRYIYNNIKFQKAGFGTRVARQLILKNSKKIILGKNVLLMPNSRIELVAKYSSTIYFPKLEIGDNSQVHQNCHITCAENITIGKNVVIVSNVTVTDIIHPYEDVSLPINKSRIKTFPVSIGNESYIYNNSVILPGTKIGKHCIIGANSVVSGIIPDYSVVVGSPARVIKSYNLKTQEWEKV